MSIKTKIENYFIWHIDLSKLQEENNNIIELSSSLIDEVYRGNSVPLGRISELDLVYEQIVSNETLSDEPHNDIERQILEIERSMDEIKPDIIQFFELTEVGSVLYNDTEGFEYVMIMNEGEIIITN